MMGDCPALSACAHTRARARTWVWPVARTGEAHPTLTPWRRRAKESLDLSLVP